MRARQHEQRGTDGHDARQDAPASASRRRFITLVGAAGGAAVLSPLLVACGGSETSDDSEQGGAEGAPANDLAIVQFALFLEYLEEDFYDQVRKSGQVGDAEVQRLVEETYRNEQAHAEALAATVEQFGFPPVDRPQSKFDAVIEAGQDRIIEVAAEVENLGASAYLGQAARIDNLRILEAALAIHTVEARHAAAFNEVAGNGFTAPGQLAGSIPDGAFAAPRTRDEVLELASPFVES